MLSLSRRCLSAVVLAALVTFAPLASSVAVANDEVLVETAVEATADTATPPEALPAEPAAEPAVVPVVSAPVVSAPIAARQAGDAFRVGIAASNSPLQYGPGEGTDPIWVTVDGTQLTASWAATIHGPEKGYRIWLWDPAANRYVFETYTMDTSFSATIVRGKSYAAFFQNQPDDVANHRWGRVDFTIPPVPNPNPVTNVTATRIATQNGFDISWLAPADNSENPATSYRVDVESGGTVQSYTTTGLTHRVVGLTVGATYSFSVVSVADDGKTGTPASTTVALEAVAPTAVNNLTLALDGSGLAASWTAPSYNGGGALSYAVSLYRDQVLVSTTSVSGTDLTVLSTADYGVPYRVEVRAVAAGAHAGPATVSASVTRPTPAPGAPTSVSATRLAEANGFDLTWNVPTENIINPAASYRIAVTTGASTAHYTTGALSYQFTGLTVGQSYTFAVTSIAADAQSSTAATTTVTLQAIEPLAVTNLAITATDSVLAATWTAPAYDGGAASLEYRVTLLGDSQVIDVYTVATPAITFAESADYGVSYTAHVRPVTSDNLSGPVSMSNTVQRADFVPGAPIAWAEGYGHKDAMVYVTWDLATTPGSPVTSLLVTLFDESGVMVEQKNLVAGYTSYSFSGLPNSTAFTASVIATNLAGSSVESNRAPATTLDLVPPAYTPEQLSQFGNPSDLSVVLSGTELTAHLVGVPEGTWVFGHAYSTPVALGWTQVDADGFARWSIAGAGLAAGQTHTLAVQDSFGGLLGSVTFAIPAPPVIAALAQSGLDDPANWIAVALAMMTLGAILSVNRVRRKAVA